MQYPYISPQFGMYQPQMQQTNTLVSVRSEEEARNSPVAPGHSVTFKDENQPFIYVKTMGFSQLETPRFDKYRLVKEEASLKAENGTLESQASISTLDSIKAEIQALWSEIQAIKEGVTDDEQSE